MKLGELDIVEFGFSLIFIFLICLGLLIFIDAGNEKSINAYSVCLKAGFSEVVFADGEAYCIRLVNGTTEVVPLREVD